MACAPGPIPAAITRALWSVWLASTDAPQFISHECSVEPTREYLEATGAKAPWELLALPYRNHTDQWVLRDLPERCRLREWLKKLGR